MSTIMTAETAGERADRAEALLTAYAAPFSEEVHRAIEDASMKGRRLVTLYCPRYMKLGDPVVTAVEKHLGGLGYKPAFHHGFLWWPASLTVQW